MEVRQQGKKIHTASLISTNKEPGSPIHRRFAQWPHNNLASNQIVFSFSECPLTLGDYNHDDGSKVHFQISDECQDLEKMQSNRGPDRLIKIIDASKQYGDGLSDILNQAVTLNALRHYMAGA